MASIQITLLEVFMVATFFLQSYTYPFQSCPYTSIFSFGDSYADTGNRAYMVEYYDGFPAKNPPYGMTFFHHPTGRCSNGRLVIDFLSEALGLPLLPPFLGEHDYRGGANFAVAGASALSAKFLMENGVDNLETNNSLGVQIEWFKQVFPYLCANSTTEESKCDALEKSLFIVGEFGGNDYLYSIISGKTIEEVQSLLPKVISAITSAVQILIDHGAKTILVTGQVPIGCLPASYRLLSSSLTKEDYNSTTGCINWLNEFSQNQNHQLQAELKKLRLMNPKFTIMYADYYNSIMPLYESPLKFEFKRSSTPCCRLCGEPGMTLCSDPSKYISWDGIHMTEASYKIISEGLLRGIESIDGNKHQAM